MFNLNNDQTWNVRKTVTMPTFVLHGVNLTTPGVTLRVLTLLEFHMYLFILSSIYVISCIYFSLIEIL